MTAMGTAYRTARITAVTAFPAMLARWYDARCLRGKSEVRAQQTWMGVLGETVARPFSPAYPIQGRRRTLLLAAMLVMILTQTWATAATATLVAGEVNMSPDGQSAVLPVSLSAPAGQRVAALQFDVEFNPAVLEIPAKGGIVEGAVTKAAGKQVNCSALSPGKMRVLIVGFNQETIANGDVAVLQFAMKRAIEREVEPVCLRNALLSDPNGSRVSEESRDGGIRRVAVAVPESSAAIPPLPVPARNQQDNLVVLWLSGVLSVLVIGTTAYLLWRRRTGARPARRVKA